MTRHFDQQIEDLLQKLVRMGRLAESMIQVSLRALVERIADQAVNICGNAHHVLQGSPLKPVIDLPVMGEVAEKMVRDSLEALVRKDCTLANEVLVEERKVDAYRDQIFRILLTHMMADPRTIERALALILISRNLER